MSDRTARQERNAQALAIVAAVVITVCIVALAIQLRGVPGP